MTEPVTPSLLEGLSLDTSGVASAVFDRRFIQSIVDQSLAAASEILVKSVDARLEEFKGRFSPSSSDTPHDSNKIEAKQITKPGNQQQFNHSVKVLEKFEVALDALDVGRVEKANEALKEGTSLVWRRIKLIRIADTSEFGWEMVNQYEADELASNSEDDKRIYRSERRAEKKHKEKKKKKSPPVRSSFSSTSTLSAAYPIPSFYRLSNRGLLRSSLGPCFHLAGNLVIFKPSAPKGRNFSQQALTLRSSGLKDGLWHACGFR